MFNARFYFTFLAVLALLLFAPMFRAHAAVADWVKGGTIQPFSTTDFASDAMMRSLDSLKSTGANSVALIIPYYQANRQSTDMYPSWNTPTDEALSKAIDYAHSIGLKVMLRPHLETDYIEWRGNIDPAPADREAWFNSYANMLYHYGRIAQTHGVEDFAIGAELLHMTNPYYDQKNTDYWKNIISRMRRLYTGKLTYSANRDFEVDVIEFWPELDYIGLSAYYDLYHAQNNSVEELKKSWDQWRSGVVQPIKEKFNKDVIITELGYRSIEGSYKQPWNWSTDGNYSEQDQANAYEATFSYWNDYPWLKGMYLWRWEINAPAPNSGDKDYSPQNKLAQTVITRWWSGNVSTPPGTTTPPNNPPPTNPPTNPPPSNPNSTLDIWWPTDNASVSGTQPWKAMLTYNDVNNYEMFWQVDGDRLNPMYDSNEDYPHKEAWVDVSGWNWRDTNVYNINVIAKDKAGNIIMQKAANIHVFH